MKLYLILTLSLILIGHSKVQAQLLTTDNIKSCHVLSFNTQNSLLVGHGFEYVGRKREFHANTGDMTIDTWVYGKSESVAICRYLNQQGETAVMIKYYLTDADSYMEFRRHMLTTGYACMKAEHNAQGIECSYVARDNSLFVIQAYGDRMLF